MNESRLTRKQKNAEQQKWYKNKLDDLDSMSFNSSFFNVADRQTGVVTEYQRMKTNYDLFNNIINKDEFEHVCSPYGKDVGKLPADFSNKDIVSGKIKALLGMEMRRPFSWKVLAVNEEATTRKEQEEFGQLQQYVIDSIMSPIELQIRKEQEEQSKGQKLSNEQVQQIEQQIQQELQTKTPQEVKRYMQRKHQDPAEALANQMLNFLQRKDDIIFKFNKGWKHACLSGKEVYWIGAVGNHPTVKVINPLYFDYDKSSEADFIQDGEWASYQMYMTFSEVIKHFGNELSPVELDEIYEEYKNVESLASSNWTFLNDNIDTTNGIRVLHAEWKALKAVKFLTYLDENGEEQLDIVDESYKLNIEQGDISIETKWVLSKYEGYKIGKDKYAFLREVPGQYKDLDNLYDCKLSYIGGLYDNLNSQVTSPMDRMKFYQYFYNILFYRIELLTASDEGKKLLINMNMIPKTAGMNIQKWMHYFTANKIGFLNPNEEGNKGQDVSNSAKEIDMSLASDIQKYIELANYIEERCGQVVGVTPQVEGQIGAYEAASAAQTAINQTASVLEPYFDLHNHIKKHVLNGLLNTAKTVYQDTQPKYLSYVLDDMSLQMIKMDYELMGNSDFGIFVSNSMKSHEAIQGVQQLSHAALQNQAIELGDVLKIMRSESVQEAEELLATAQNERQEREAAQQKQIEQAKLESEQKAREFKEREHEMALEEITLKEQLQKDREIQKQLILSMGFNEDKDMDKDGMPDVMEVAKFNLEADLKARKQDLDEKKHMHSEKMDKEKIKLENKKLSKNNSNS